MKIRVIPTILTDGSTVVKGENFNNWRTVGSAEATARLFASRNVDELLFLDVNARSRGETINLSLIQTFSDLLDIPYAVGGGINTYDDAATCFRNGAEKVVLGTSAIMNQNLISEVANGFGAQAIIVALDVNGYSSENLWTHSGTRDSGVTLSELAPKLEELGAGEILIQNISNDGKMKGMDFERVKLLSRLTNLPLIASSGCGGFDDAVSAVEAGASAVAAGALFQFTEITPPGMRNYLAREGIKVRIT
jgi:cyclase